MLASVLVKTENLGPCGDPILRDYSSAPVFTPTAPSAFFESPSVLMTSRPTPGGPAAHCSRDGVRAQHRRILRGRSGTETHHDLENVFDP